jgi:hypothetical protein
MLNLGLLPDVVDCEGDPVRNAPRLGDRLAHGTVEPIARTVFKALPARLGWARHRLRGSLRGHCNRGLKSPGARRPRIAEGGVPVRLQAKKPHNAADLRINASVPGRAFSALRILRASWTCLRVSPTSEAKFFLGSSPSCRPAIRAVDARTRPGPRHRPDRSPGHRPASARPPWLRRRRRRPAGRCGRARPPACRVPRGGGRRCC